MRLYLLAAVAVLGQHVFGAEDVSVTRHLFVLTQAFLDSAETRTIPANIPGDITSTVVLFRLSERGTLIDARAVGGSDQGKASALAAIRTWQFKPTLLNGRPVQMHSAIVFDFATSPVTIKAPPAMSADQISPVLTARCSLAISNRTREALSICRKESERVLASPTATPMEVLSAHHELAVALLQTGKKDIDALRELDEAIKLAPQGLTDADGEWGQLYWQRALAREHLGRRRDAISDLDTAAKALSKAADASGLSAYREMLAEVTAKQAALIEAEHQKN